MSDYINVPEELDVMETISKKRKNTCGIVSIVY